jgi:predicted nucleotidyltransferase
MNLVEAIAETGLTDSVPGLTASARRSDELIARMRDELAKHGVDDEMDVFAFGSLARREYTVASDVDYLVIVDSMPDDMGAPRALVERVQALIAEETRADGASTSKNPGTSGLFGRATGIFDIVQQVGLQDDTNHTHTVRMEILQESVSLLNPDLHQKILDRTIRRYLDVFGAPRPDRPPRFLLNDMLRYWRQITIDYQAKAPVGVHEPKAVLRHLKLLTTRKNFFASSVLPLVAPRDDTVPWATYLNDVYSMPPLARLAAVTKSAPDEVLSAVREVFTAIDLFVQRTDDKDKRLELESISWESRRDDIRYQELRAAAERLQAAYQSIFMGGWADIQDKTLRYMLF